jgi:hypothetical protein
VTDGNVRLWGIVENAGQAAAAETAAGSELDTALVIEPSVPGERG